MSTIDIKLKTYDQLVFEITRLNTDKYLLEQKLKQKENIIKEVREILESKKHCERLFGGVEGKTFIEQVLEILDKEKE